MLDLLQHYPVLDRRYDPHDISIYFLVDTDADTDISFGSIIVTVLLLVPAFVASSSLDPTTPESILGRQRIPVSGLGGRARSQQRQNYTGMLLCAA